MILLISFIWCVVSSGFATRRIRNILASVWVDFWAPRTKGDRDGGHFSVFRLDKHFAIAVLFRR